MSRPRSAVEKTQVGWLIEPELRKRIKMRATELGYPSIGDYLGFALHVEQKAAAVWKNGSPQEAPNEP